MAENQRKRWLSIAINAVSFEFFWLLAVTAPWLWVLVATAVFVLIHQLWVVEQSRDWFGIVLLALVGWLLDSLIASAGIVAFHRQLIIVKTFVVAPLWLLCLWIGFVTTVFYSLYRLHTWLKTAAVIGALSAPWSYLLGATLSPSEILSDWPVFFAVYAVVWGLYLPLMLVMAARFRFSSNAFLRRSNPDV